MDDLTALQDLIDASFARSSAHLRAIMTEDRRLTAERIARDFPCPAVLNIATVTRTGEPRISAVDGHLLDGALHFTTDASSPKAVQLLARPAISASYTPRDGYGVFCHGTAVALEGDGRAMLHDHFVEVYDADPDQWGDIGYFRIDPTWFVGFAMTEEEMAKIEQERAAKRGSG